MHGPTIFSCRLMIITFKSFRVGCGRHSVKIFPKTRASASALHCLRVGFLSLVRPGYFLGTHLRVSAIFDFPIHTLKRFADRLQVSESSVKSSLQQLFDKTGVHTRSQLVRVALERFKHQI